MDTLQLSLDRQAEVVVVRVDGRLDGNTAPEFGEFIMQKIRPDDQAIIFDATGLEFISSAGLRELVVLAKRLAGRRARAVFVGLKPGVREALEISGLISLFLEAPDHAGAVAELGRAKSGGGLMGHLFGGRTGQ